MFLGMPVQRVEASDWQVDKYLAIINLEAWSREGQTKPKSRAQLRVRKITANSIKPERPLEKVIEGLH